MARLKDSYYCALIGNYT